MTQYMNEVSRHGMYISRVGDHYKFMLAMISHVLIIYCIVYTFFFAVALTSPIHINKFINCLRLLFILMYIYDTDVDALGTMFCE